MNYTREIIEPALKDCSARISFQKFLMEDWLEMDAKIKSLEMKTEKTWEWLCSVDRGCTWIPLGGHLHPGRYSEKDIIERKKEYPDCLYQKIEDTLKTIEVEAWDE